MEKKSFISTYQIVMLLFVTRLLFSTSYQSILQAGNSLQDLIVSAAIGFIVNIIAAIPILVLLKLYPQHDLAEIGILATGRVTGSFFAILYFFFFIFNAAITTGNFENFFVTTVIPDVKMLLPGLMLVIICLYGASKGIESIARFGGIVAVIYIVVFLIISLSIMPKVEFDHLTPLFYNGPSLMMRGVVMNYNVSIQIVALAFLASFIKPGKDPKKTFFMWNLLSSVTFILLEIAIVTVSGAYGAKNHYPVHLLASVSQFSVFERLDSVDMISWILNMITTVTLYIYLGVNCLIKLGLDKHRRLLILVSGIIVFIISLYISKNMYTLQMLIVSEIYAVINTVFIILIPTLILITGKVKGKVLQNAKE